MRLESIRNRSGLLFVVIGVAMFAFIMMDLMSSQRGGASVDLSVGEVYGEEIDVQEFEARVQRQFDVQKQNNPKIGFSKIWPILCHPVCKMLRISPRSFLAWFWSLLF